MLQYIAISDSSAKEVGTSPMELSEVLSASVAKVVYRSTTTLWELHEETGSVPCLYMYATCGFVFACMWLLLTEI